jgi:hypothetical protein
MAYVYVFLIGVAFTLFAALIFSVLTLLFGKFSGAFDVDGPDEWSFGAFYARYLIVAAVYTFVSIPVGGVLGIGALALAYKYVFDAGWTQAIVMGLVGGIIALILFMILMMLVISPILEAQAALL